MILPAYWSCSASEGLLLTGGAIAGFVGGPAGDGRPGWQCRASQLLI